MSTTEAHSRTTLDDLRRSNEVVITKKLAAEVLGIDVRTLTGGIQRGQIPSVNVGRRVLIPRLPFLTLFGADQPVSAAS
ncbi:MULTISPECIES: helix-turn-helix domain-containing protein [Rhodococcus]|uniref:Helix-turn-helix domain-containing protein n=1 Tax=Rhodococcus cercidiphylli TaxID=489916 RepID=A0ABU4B0B0_9NOCA|nr:MULTISPECIES: helix-turn-helix domain-containing protein [Rhodococcus]MDV6231925.1 helix-turn-helix domain-containing protein [Rhodococcus cercidiphylli]